MLADLFKGDNADTSDEEACEDASEVDKEYQQPYWLDSRSLHGHQALTKQTHHALLDVRTRKPFECSEESPPNRVIARRLSVQPLLNVHEDIITITRFRCLYTNKNKITTLHTWSVCTSQARTFTACIQCLFRVDTQSSQINANDTRWKIGFAFYLNTPHYLIVQLNCSSPLWPQQQMLIKIYIYSYFKWVHCKYVKAALSVQIKASYSPYYIFLALSLWIFLL